MSIRIATRIDNAKLAAGLQVILIWTCENGVRDMLSLTQIMAKVGVWNFNTIQKESIFRVPSGLFLLNEVVEAVFDSDSEKGLILVYDDISTELKEFHLTGVVNGTSELRGHRLGSVSSRVERDIKCM